MNSIPYIFMKDILNNYYKYKLCNEYNKKFTECNNNLKNNNCDIYLKFLERYKCN
jgi:hypothetical protein